jgi:hypothetical protein
MIETLQGFGENRIAFVRSRAGPVGSYQARTAARIVSMHYYPFNCSGATNRATHDNLLSSLRTIDANCPAASLAMNSGLLAVANP